MLIPLIQMCINDFKNFENIDYHLHYLEFRNDCFHKILTEYKIEKTFGKYNVIKLINTRQINKSVDFSSLLTASHYIEEMRKLDRIEKRYKYQFLIQWYKLTGLTTEQICDIINIKFVINHSNISYVKNLHEIESCKNGIFYIMENNKFYIKENEYWKIVTNNI